MRRSISIVPAVLLLAACQVQAGDWPRFRGPDGSGTSAETNLPLTWSASENIAWTTPLPGPGSSSPIVVGDRVFVACYSGYGIPGLRNADKSDLRLHVVCVDRESGEVIWDQSMPASRAERDYRGFVMEHGYASATPASDGQAVYAFFGCSGVVAYDLEGKRLWTTSVGNGTHNFGSGTSPIVFEDLVIVNASVESGALVALNRSNGNPVWRVDGVRMSWNTPLVLNLPDGRQELVFNMRGQAIGVDPASGRRLWRCEAINDYICPSLVAHEDVVFATGGRRNVCVAIRAGGKGDVSDTHRLWTAPAGSNVPSPTYFEGHLYWVNDRGQAFCVDAQTGEVVTRRRLPNAGRVYASVLIADGRIYAVTRERGTFVLSADPEMKQLAHNTIAGDRTRFDGSPAVSDGTLYLRSNKALYAIRNGR